MSKVTIAKRTPQQPAHHRNKFFDSQQQNIKQYNCTDIQISEFCLSANVHPIDSNNEGDFKISTVYSPTAYNCKHDFFAELVTHKPPSGVRWLALGDFNQIRRARDKNKGNINRSRIIRFRAAH
jgi:hypothetical protein